MGRKELRTCGSHRIWWALRTARRWFRFHPRDSRLLLCRATYLLLLQDERAYARLFMVRCSSPSILTSIMTKELFGTDGIRGIPGKYPLDDATLYGVARALGKYLLERDAKPRVLIGMDTRESGPHIAAQLAAGLADDGVAFVSAGVISTPGVACLVRQNKFSAGMVISASHNPFHDNGVKLFAGTGMKFPDEVEEHLEIEIHNHKDYDTAPHGIAVPTDRRPGDRDPQQAERTQHQRRLRLAPSGKSAEEGDRNACRAGRGLRRRCRPRDVRDRQRTPRGWRRRVARSGAIPEIRRPSEWRTCDRHDDGESRPRARARSGRLEPRSRACRRPLRPRGDAAQRRESGRRTIGAHHFSRRRHHRRRPAHRTQDGLPRGSPRPTRRLGLRTQDLPANDREHTGEVQASARIFARSFRRNRHRHENARGRRTRRRALFGHRTQ